MSHARFGPDSDIYMFEHAHGFIQCCGCKLSPTEKVTAAHWFGRTLKDNPELNEEFEIYTHFDFYTRKQALDHLTLHRKMGHKVPQDAIDRLTKELDTEGDYVHKYSGPD